VTAATRPGAEAVGRGEEAVHVQVDLGPDRVRQDDLVAGRRPGRQDAEGQAQAVRLPRLQHLAPEGVAPGAGAGGQVVQVGPSDGLVLPTAVDGELEVATAEVTADPDDERDLGQRARRPGGSQGDRDPGTGLMALDRFAAARHSVREASRALRPGSTPAVTNGEAGR